MELEEVFEEAMMKVALGAQALGMAANG